MGAASCHEDFCAEGNGLADEEDFQEKAMRGAVVQTARGIVFYPNGIAADRLNRHGPHQSMRALNTGVSGILINNGAQETYAEFAEAIAEPIQRLPWRRGGTARNSLVGPVGSRDSSDEPSERMTMAEVARIVQDFDERFRRNNVSVHLCIVESSGVPNTKTLSRKAASQASKEPLPPARWLTYVDRVLHPNYVVEHDVLGRGRGPGPSDKAADAEQVHAFFLSKEVCGTGPFRVCSSGCDDAGRTEVSQRELEQEMPKFEVVVVASGAPITKGSNGL